MAINVTSSAYSGEVLENLLTVATTGNQMVEGGHIRIVPNVAKKFTLPTLTGSTFLQKRKESPSAANSKGDFSYGERYLEPQEMMVYTRFNPRVLENVWRPFQPKGNLAFAELPSNAQSQMLEILGGLLGEELEKEYIFGEKGANEGQYFDGIITRCRAENSVVSITTPEALTASNIIEKLEEVRKNIPTRIKNSKNLKLFISPDDYELYDKALTDMTYKGVDATILAEKKYKGVQLVVIPSWPKDVMLCTVASMEIDSNLWAGVSLTDDIETVLIDKVAADSELYFFKMLLKADTNIVFPNLCVFYDAVTV